MPDSQQPMHDNNANDEAAYREWASQVSKGVHQIISGPRGNIMPHTAKLDLCACLNLIDGEDPLSFAWDISMYTNPPPLNAPRLATDKVRSIRRDKAYSRPDSDEDYDEEDLDTIARPQWNRGEVRILKMTEAPYWAMVRYISFQSRLLRFVTQLILIGSKDSHTNVMGSGWALSNVCSRKIRNPTGKANG